MFLLQTVWRWTITGFSKKSALCPALTQTSNKGPKWPCSINSSSKVKLALQSRSQAYWRDITNYVPSYICQPECNILVILPHKSRWCRGSLRGSLGLRIRCPVRKFEEHLIECEALWFYNIHQISSSCLDRKSLIFEIQISDIIVAVALCA